MKAAELLIDKLGRLAESEPHAPILPERIGGAWNRLTYAEAWAGSGAVASWLIAQGFGPGGHILSVQAGDSPERAVLLLGALRAGALVIEGGPAALTFVAKDGRLVAKTGVAFAALARCSIDASVAERRLHIDARTPARRWGEVRHCHGDLTGVAQAISLASGPPPVDGTI